MPEDRARDGLGGPLMFAALAVAGTLLAILAVYVGTGLHDGFGGRDLLRLWQRYRGMLPWAIPLAAVAGVLAHAFYARLLRKGPPVWLMLPSMARAFVHFPLFGMLALLALLWGMLLAVVDDLLRRVESRQATGVIHAESASVFDRWLALPIWFIALPFIMLKLPNEGEMELPDTISPRRLLRWLPAVLVLPLFAVGAVSDETGERVDPYWLTAAAGFWLTDYLMVAFRIAPALRRQR